eukprot:CAMPEP_0184693094 /NCGR_PEP_ID=MMETSP0313-20130426/1396_1 /TAXON_ID=2792 /ORGANISM="Porphyridium aerugineum, Strain SAG 1380-2" /LENGTH=101 /DNA_ID=CAMNT_0027151063 /DNA_START=205 /DNA_END=507 /DNA_ORIENTATION=+
MTIKLVDRIHAAELANEYAFLKYGDIELVSSTVRIYPSESMMASFRLSILSKNVPTGHKPPFLLEDLGSAELPPTGTTSSEVGRSANSFLAMMEGFLTFSS